MLFCHHIVFKISKSYFLACVLYDDLNRNDFRATQPLFVVQGAPKMLKRPVFHWILTFKIVFSIRFVIHCWFLIKWAKFLLFFLQKKTFFNLWQGQFDIWHNLLDIMFDYIILWLIRNTVNVVFYFTSLRDV